MKYLSSLALLLAACSQPPRVECGPGTLEQGGVCVAQPQSQTASLLDSGIEGTLTTKTTSFIWQSLPSGQESTLYDMTKFGSELFVVGENGTILRSADQGQSWEAVKVETTKHLYDSFTNNKYLFVCGAAGTVLRSKDGKVWEDISAPDTRDLFDISVEGNEILAIGQRGTIIYSTPPDGERAKKDEIKWRVWASGTESDLSDSTKKGAEVFIVGSAGVVLRASKLGEPLTQTKVGRRDLIATRVQSKSVYVTADDGSIQRLRGEEWSEVTAGTSHRLLDFWDTNGLFAVGDEGVILQAPDFGAPWEQQQSGTPSTLFGVYRAFEKRFAVGDNGVILVFEPWNLWVSNKSEVPLRIRTNSTSTVLEPKQSVGLTIAEDNKLLEYIDEEANVFQLPFQLSPQKKYRVVCGATPQKKLECQDPTNFLP